MIGWLLLLVLIWPIGFLLLWREPRCRRGSTEQRSVSVVIPARNEARNLPRLLGSLRDQRVKPAEILVVDDESTDGTTDIARAYGAQVVEAGPLPVGWRGKAWACHRGAQAAESEWLAFMDADTWLAPDGLGGLLHEAVTRKVEALSAGPYHRPERFHEQWSAPFNLIAWIGMGAFSAFGSADRPAGLFGPFLLIARSAYDRVGGHAAVRGEILEHMRLTPLLREAGVPMACLSGRPLLSIRMYPEGFRSLCEGWVKAFAAGADQTPPAIMAMLVLWISAAMASFFTALFAPWVAGSPVPAWGLYALFVLQIGYLLSRVGRFSPAVALFYPVFFAFFFWIFGRSAARHGNGRPVAWRGRTIVAPRAREPKP